MLGQNSIVANLIQFSNKAIIQGQVHQRIYSIVTINDGLQTIIY